jgi:YYY domain-containing protein
MGAVLVWWLVVQLVGLLALPLAYRVFKGLPDRGWAFARPLGLLLAGYVFWLAGSLGLLGNNLGGVIVALIVLAGVSLYFGRGALGIGRKAGDETPSLWQFIRANKWTVIATELLFFVVLAGWAWYRSFAPEITTAGGEKFMEYAFINGILRSPTLPPADPWLSGFAISYYYFGYLIMTMLIRLSGLASSVAFNLSLALLFAMTLTGAFSLVFNLVRLARPKVARGAPASAGKAIGFGLLGSVLLGVMGNLEGFLELLYLRGVGGAAFWKWLDIRDLTGAPAAVGGVPQRFMWWWRASRVLQDHDLLGKPIEIIDEFPFFSFMLGDIHPHVLALPFAMLMLALALNLLADKGGSVLAGLKRFSPTLLLYAVCFGGLLFLNTWDFPIYLGILVLALAARAYLEHKGFTRAWLLDVVMSALMLAVLGVVLYLPFLIGFTSQAGGLAPTLWARTRIQQYLVMFGPFIFVVVGLLSLLLVEVMRRHGAVEEWRPGALAIGGVGLALVVLSVATGRWLGVILALCLTAATYAFWRLLRRDEPAEKGGEGPDAATLFALLLLFVGLALTFVVEYVYLVDTFNNRMNTIFKFYFQAWALLAVGAGYGVYYVIERAKSAGRAVFGVGFALLLAAGLVYPLFAAPNRANSFEQKPSLDGIAYIKQVWPADFAAVEWLRQNVKDPQAVILEANGGSYTEYGRVSAMTGIPTLLGWGGHELQWRGNYDEPGKREPDIEKVYRSTDVNQVKAVLEQYRVTHVYVGQLEREKFKLSNPLIEKFGVFMDLVYDQGGVRIYRRRGV